MYRLWKMNSGYKLKEATWQDYFRLEALVRSRASCDYRPWRNSTRKLVSGPFEGSSLPLFLQPSSPINCRSFCPFLPPDFDPTLMSDSHFYVYCPKFLDRIEIERMKRNIQFVKFPFFFCYS